MLGLAVAILGLSVVAVVVDLPDPEQLRRWVGGNGTWGPLVFFLLCAVGTATFFPKPVLATASGLLFGILPGLAIAVAGFTAGALISFAVGRSTGRRAVARRLGTGRLRVLDAVFARSGLAATLVLRLLPVIPFTASNYGAGVTSVAAGSFAAGTALGLIPTTALAATLGDAVFDVDSPRSIAAAAAWIVLALVGVVWGGQLLRRAHRQA